MMRHVFGMVMSSTLALSAVTAAADQKTNAPNALVVDTLLAEEIVVTGTKRNASLQDTETSVAVFSSKMIREQALFNVVDILLRTANVATAGGDALNNLSIRGITLGGVGFAGTGATANVYVDGAPNSFNSNQGASNLWDVAQVEILRGPQSTVQGRNALSGAVVIRTADPEYDYGLDARILIGSQENRQFSAAVTGPIIDDQLAFRLVADYREIDFGVTNVDTGIPARFREDLTLRGKLLFEPQSLEGLRIELTGTFTDTSFGEFNEVNSQVAGDDPLLADFDPFGDETFGNQSRLEDNQVARLISDIQYAVNENWTVFAIGTMEDVNRDTQFGLDGSSISRDRTYSGELRSGFEYERVSGWFGGYYFRQKIPNTISFTGPFFGLPVDPPDSVFILDTASEEVTENYALFADITVDINQTWSVNIGARYDWESFDNSGLVGTSASDPATCVIQAFVPFIGGAPCASVLPTTSEPPTQADFNAFLPRATITYNIDDLRSVSFGIQRGYRAGGSFIRGNANDGVQLLQFDPEFLTNYEISFRSQWLDQRLTVNANIFYSDWSDQQVSIPGPSGFALDVLTTNVGSSELYGLELDVTAQVTPQLSVFASLGLLHTEFTNFPFAVDGIGNPVNTADPQFANLAGNEFNSAPAVNISAGATYEHDSGFFANGNVAYASSQFSDVTNLAINEADSYVLVNARVGYRTGPLELAIFANNLFDERFIQRQGLFTVNTATGTPEPNNPAFFIVNEPRIFGGEVRISF